METDETKYGRRREQWGREDPSGNARGKVGRGVPFSAGTQDVPRKGWEAQVSAKRNIYVVVCICGLCFITWTSHSVVSSLQLGGQSPYQALVGITLLEYKAESFNCCWLAVLSVTSVRRDVLGCFV